MAAPQVQIITSSNSEQASRNIINANFKALSVAISNAQHVSIFDVVNLNILKPLTPNLMYGLRYNVNDDGFDLKPMFNDGIKFTISSTESLYVPPNNQYIVNNYFFADGDVIIDGELVIL